MPRWSPAREGALEALAAEILTHYAKGRVAVAVDGAEGSGSREFATDHPAPTKEAFAHDSEELQKWGL